MDERAIAKVCMLDQVRSETPKQVLLQCYLLPICSPTWIEYVFKCEIFFHA